MHHWTKCREDGNHGQEHSYGTTRSQGDRDWGCRREEDRELRECCRKMCPRAWRNRLLHVREKPGIRIGSFLLTIGLLSAGAAGNFISPISGLSANAFKAVLDIDTIGSVCDAVFCYDRVLLTLAISSSTPSKRLFHSSSSLLRRIPTQEQIARLADGLSSYLQPFISPVCHCKLMSL